MRFVSLFGLGGVIRVRLRNILADCLAKSAPLLSLKKGFRCDPEHLKWERRRTQFKQDRTTQFGLYCPVSEHSALHDPARVKEHGFILARRVVSFHLQPKL